MFCFEKSGNKTEERRSSPRFLTIPPKITHGLQKLIKQATPRQVACKQLRRRRMRGMNQAICIRGVAEGAEMAFFERWSHPVYIPVIPNCTERVELNAGLKTVVRAHLRLGMNRGFCDRPKSACSRFRGDAERRTRMSQFAHQAASCS